MELIKDVEQLYLNLGKSIILKYEEENLAKKNIIQAYVYLKNKIFINAYLIKSKLGSADLSVNHKLSNKFIKLMHESEDLNG